MSVEQDNQIPIAPGGADIAHWDPTDPRDMLAIARRYERSPRAFRTMDEDKQARVVRIVNNAMLEAERMQQSDDDATRQRAVDLAQALARASGVLVSLRLKDEHHAADHNQRERHHADDVKRGANEGAKVQTIVLVGAEQSRLLRPPEGT